jgi:hypothetical protein
MDGESSLYRILFKPRSAAGRSAGRTGSQPATGAGAAATAGPGGGLASAPLPEFAAAVQAFADRAPADGMFSGGKAFIADVWDSVRGTPEGRGLTLESFKARLVEANRVGLVELSRLDLPAAVTPPGDPGGLRTPTGPGTGRRTAADIRRAEIGVDPVPGGNPRFQTFTATFHMIRRSGR